MKDKIKELISICDDCQNGTQVVNCEECVSYIMDELNKILVKMEIYYG